MAGCRRSGSSTPGLNQQRSPSTGGPAGWSTCVAIPRARSRIPSSYALSRSPPPGCRAPSGPRRDRPPPTGSSLEYLGTRCRRRAQDVEVLTLIAQAHSNGEIAQQLYVAEATVKTHVNRILAKTGARDRTQAAAY